MGFAPIPREMRVCPTCSHEFAVSQRLCPRDGSVLEDTLPPEERLLGQTLAGKYRIEGFLSQGGMGAVYRATHLMLGKPVALKLIRPEIVTSPEVVRRFQREARAASLLSHPNIVTIHDLGQAEDGTLYLAMELCEGMCLKDLIVAEGPLVPRRAALLCRDIGGALALAHQHGIVHRDLKPQNVMVGRGPDGREVPKLLDFGIAKAVESDGATLTSTGMVLGTPRYMSPEQAKGLPVDGRSELYSLGIIFYEMLCGRVPFDDPSVPSLLVKHMAEPPQPPSALRPEVPPRIETIVLRLLEKDPAHRFQRAEDLCAALANLEPGAPRQDAPTLPGATLPTPVYPATDAAAGEGTITDPRPGDAPARAGTPGPTLPTPRIPVSARRPVRPKAARRRPGWPVAAASLLAAGVGFPFLTRTKSEAPPKPATPAMPGKAAREPATPGSGTPPETRAPRAAPYHPYSARNRTAKEHGGDAEPASIPEARPEPAPRETPAYPPPLPPPPPRAGDPPPPPPWFPPPPDARHPPPPPPFDPHRPPPRLRDLGPRG